MSLFSFGGSVIEIPGSTQQPFALTYGELTQRVASRLRGKNDPDLLQVSRDGILWAIEYANITRQLMFGSNEPAQIDLVEDVSTIALPANFVGIRMVTLEYANYQGIDAADVGEKAMVLEWMPWLHFNQMSHTVSDVPMYWSAQDTFTTGVIHIRPRPNADSVARYKLRLWLWKQIDIPSQDVDVIAAPKDYSSVLVEGGKAYLLRERTTDLGEKAFQMNLFENMIARHAASERGRHGARTAVWRVGGA